MKKCLITVNVHKVKSSIKKRVG